MNECNRCLEKIDSCLLLCPNCGNEMNFKETDKKSILPLAEFEFEANFTKASVWLWNTIWGLVSIAVTFVALNTIIQRGLSVGTFLSLIAGSWFARISLKVSFSIWKTKIYVYKDRLTLRGVVEKKSIEFSNTYFKYNYLRLAGGSVLYLTESFPNKILSRLNRYLFLNNVMIIHPYLLSDDDYQALFKLLSDISGRPESEIRFARTFVPFYPKKEDVFNAPTKLGVRNAVIIIGITSYVLLFLLWLISESSKAHIGILVMATLMPFVLALGYALGNAEEESYKETKNKDRQQGS